MLFKCRETLNVTGAYDGDNFFTFVDGVKRGTPLLLALAVIELSDVIFAVDSIPAVQSTVPQILHLRCWLAPKITISSQHLLLFLLQVFGSLFCMADHLSTGTCLSYTAKYFDCCLESSCQNCMECIGSCRKSSLLYFPGCDRLSLNQASRELLCPAVWDLELYVKFDISGFWSDHRPSDHLDVQYVGAVIVAEPLCLCCCGTGEIALPRQSHCSCPCLGQHQTGAWVRGLWHQHSFESWGGCSYTWGRCGCQSGISKAMTTHTNSTASPNVYVANFGVICHPHRVIKQILTFWECVCNDESCFWGVRPSFLTNAWAWLLAHISGQLLDFSCFSTVLCRLHLWCKIPLKWFSCTDSLFIQGASHNIQCSLDVQCS